MVRAAFYFICLLTSSSFAQEIKQFPVQAAKNNIVVTPLGANINTKYHEKLPVISPDGKSLYFARESEEKDSHGQGDIYFSTLNKNGEWSMAQNIGKPLNNGGNNFIFSITPDGKTLLLGNSYNPDGTEKGAGVSISHKTSSGWSVPENLTIDQYTNTNQYGSFYLSNDGQFLLMNIETPASHGKLDLYVSFKGDRGNWKKPVNLGPTINTNLSETNPFLAADGRTLYFASNGHPGFGGYDIFACRRLDASWTNWTTPINLGPEINSTAHEISFSIPASGKVAYIYGLKDKTNQCDIFQVKIKNTPASHPKTAHLLKENSSDNLHLQWQTALQAPGLRNSNTSYLDEIIPGDASVQATQQDLNLKASTQVKSFRTMAETLATNPTFTIAQDQINPVTNILFTQSKAEVLSSSFPTMELLARIMKTHPALTIELNGHTDNQGDAGKNISLSEDRVKTVKNYLVSMGIPKRRISMNAFGSLHLLSNNPAEERRKMNRRVEVKILKI